MITRRMVSSLEPISKLELEYVITIGAYDSFLARGLKLEKPRNDNHEAIKVKLKRRGRDLYIDDKKISFWLSTEQRHCVTNGHILLGKLRKKPVLDFSVGYYLLSNPHLIPFTWKKYKKGIRYIYFWKSICICRKRKLYVPCLYWDQEWHLDYGCIDLNFDAQSQAAVLTRLSD